MKHHTYRLTPLLLLLVFWQAPAQAQENVPSQPQCASWLDHTIGKLHSNDTIDLCRETAGKVVLLVNTASYCGYTYQFTGLEQLYQRYRDQGLVIIGFPSDDFNQEDDDAARTAKICYINHGVTFTMTEVVGVTPPGIHPVFRHLGRRADEPDWNFNKYLVDQDGRIVRHFRSTVEPDSPQLTQSIERLLSGG